MHVRYKNQYPNDTLHAKIQVLEFENKKITNFRSTFSAVPIHEFAANWTVDRKEVIGKLS